MARHRKFNCGKKKQKSSASQNRHPTLSQYIKSDYEPEMMAHFCRKFSVCCGCGKMESTTVLLQMEETSNELFCMACLQDCNPSNEWWGSIEPTSSEHEACDNDDWEHSPIHTLAKNQTWEEAIGLWQRNMQLVPSKGDGFHLYSCVNSSTQT